MLRPWVAAVPLVAAACAGGSTLDGLCQPGETERWALPPEIPEASGLAVSRARPGLVWTHNDGEEGVLFGLELHEGESHARVVERVRVPGPFRDVEDLELARCATGWCLFLADSGDNAERRTSGAVVRVPEPGPGDSLVVPESVLRLEYAFPDHPRDVEALAVLPGEAVHLLSKGRSGPPTWYRVPGEDEPSRTASVVGPVTSQRPLVADQVTGATWVDGSPGLAVVRTYRSLELHEISAQGARLRAGPHSLVHLSEPQGEALALAPDGHLLLASEAGPLGGHGGVIRVRCRE